jgi:hypothetical protein
MGMAALAIWVRTVLRHDIAAYVVAGAIAVGLFAASNLLRIPLLGWNLDLLKPLTAPYIAAVGRDFDWPRYVEGVLNTGLLSLLFLTLACYHTHRQEPQRFVLGGYGKHWADLPTLPRLISDLKIDRRVGLSVHLLLLATVALSATVGYRSVVEGLATKRRLRHWAVEMKRELPEQAPAVDALRIRHYAGTVEIAQRDTLACDLRIEIENTTQTAVEHLALTLPFGLDVRALESDGGTALRVRQWGNILVADLPAPLAPATTAILRMAYEGRPLAVEIGERVFFSSDYQVALGDLSRRGVALGAKYMRFNTWLLPQLVALVPEREFVRPAEVPALFTADLTFALFHDLDIVSPDGELESLGTGEGRQRARLRIVYPQSALSLLAGPYVRVERQFGDLPLSVYCFEGNRDTVEFALVQLEETLERWGKVLGATKNRDYSLVESPFEEPGAGAMPRATVTSQQIEHLARYRPLYEEREGEGMAAVYRFQAIFTRALAAAMLRQAFHPEKRIMPLRDALYYYLVSAVRTSQIGPLAQKSPFLFTSQRGNAPGALLNAVQRMEYNTPLLERMARTGFMGFHATHIWRMLHYLLEDKGFAEFLRALAAEYHDRIVALDDLRAVAERFYGDSLDSFFDHWFLGRGAPEYHIAQARARMTENERTRDIEYDVRISVGNRGRGRMPVPVVLRTERDLITRRLWIDPGSTGTLILRVVDRPEMAFVDPEGWVTQVNPPTAEGRLRGLASRKVVVVE